jgi:hypothetical protein
MAMRDKAPRANIRIAGFLTEMRENAKQLDPLEKLYRILSHSCTGANFSRHCLRLA